MIRVSVCYEICIGLNAGLRRPAGIHAKEIRIEPDEEMGRETSAAVHPSQGLHAQVYLSSPIHFSASLMALVSSSLKVTPIHFLSSFPSFSRISVGTTKMPFSVAKSP